MLCLVCDVLSVQPGLSDQSCFETIDLHQYVTIVVHVHPFDYVRIYVVPLQREQIATTYVTNDSMCVLMYLLFTVS
jgi:hypothetical protein